MHAEFYELARQPPITPGWRAPRFAVACAVLREYAPASMPASGERFEETGI
jgi:hypothetical protein